MRILLFFFALLIGFSSVAQAKRLALVIGNDDYQHLPKLHKSINDAVTLKQTLVHLGFEVIYGQDIAENKFYNLLKKLRDKINYGDEVLFFFSGHGISVKGQNYLLPVNSSKTNLGLHVAFNPDEINNLIETSGAFSLMIVDTIRPSFSNVTKTQIINNPISVSRRSPPPGGSQQSHELVGRFILYSAAAGQFSYDRLNNKDKNPNSIFMRVLLPLMKEPHLELRVLVKSLRRKMEELISTVSSSNNISQRPAYYDEYLGSFYFVKKRQNISRKHHKQEDIASELGHQENKKNKTTIKKQMAVKKRILEHKVIQRKNKRVALIIGNDDYINVTKLQKAVNDARAVAATMRTLGFQVLEKSNADRRAMDAQLNLLSKTISAGDEVLFFFAGHGIAVKGRNYLLPTNIPKIKPGQERSVTKEAFSEDEIIEILRERGAKVSMLIIDACRNNPFPKAGTRSVGRSVGLGQRANPPRNTFVMYSAGIGEEALDRLSDEDQDPNSVFTRKLLPLLSTPGLSHLQMAKQLQVEVEALALTTADQHKQFPAFYDQVRGHYYLVPGKPIVKKDVPLDRSGEETFWRSIDGSSKISDYALYLKEFPQGRYAPVARLKQKRLEEKKKLTLAPPPKRPIETKNPSSRKVSVGEHVEFVHEVYKLGGVIKLGLTRSTFSSCEGCVPILIYCLDQIKNPNKLKGLKIVSRGPSAEFVKQHGGKHLVLPLGEFVPAYQRGLVQCIASGGALPKYSLNGPLPKSMKHLKFPKSKY